MRKCFCANSGWFHSASLATLQCVLTANYGIGADGFMLLIEGDWSAVFCPVNKITHALFMSFGKYFVQTLHGFSLPGSPGYIIFAYYVITLFAHIDVRISAPDVYGIMAMRLGY